MDERETNSDTHQSKEDREKYALADTISAVALFVFGLFVTGSGIYIAAVSRTGDEQWYTSPGMFPIFIGSVLCVLSALLFLRKWTLAITEYKEKKQSRVDSGESRREMRRKALRLVTAVSLLAVYIFSALGRLPFPVATFLYLSVTMIAFREGNFAIWKLLLISAAVSTVLYVTFGVLVGIPLP